MPNPKRKTSKTRRDKRRTHYKATAKQWLCVLLRVNIIFPHRAFWLEGKLYYNGRVVMEKEVLA
jgi:large subunit ribosomal protein L32